VIFKALPCQPDILDLSKCLHRKAGSPGVSVVGEANQGVIWPQNWKVIRRKRGRECCFMLPVGRELSASEMQRFRENPAFSGANSPGSVPQETGRR